jgi:hypothetical protein
MRSVREQPRAPSGENSMLDTLMLVFGAGMFVLLLGYVAICDRI